MAITQAQKDEVSKLLDNLNLGTKKAEVGKKILAMIEEATGENVSASSVNVDADATNGIEAGDLQTVLSSLATRIKALEPA